MLAQCLVHSTIKTFPRTINELKALTVNYIFLLFADQCEVILKSDTQIKNDVMPYDVYPISAGWQCNYKCLFRYNTTHICWAAVLISPTVCRHYFTDEPFMYFLQGEDSWLDPQTGASTYIIKCHYGMSWFTILLLQTTFQFSSNDFQNASIMGNKQKTPLLENEMLL